MVQDFFHQQYQISSNAFLGAQPHLLVPPPLLITGCTGQFWNYNSDRRKGTINAEKASPNHCWKEVSLWGSFTLHQQVSGKTKDIRQKIIKRHVNESKYHQKVETRPLCPFPSRNWFSSPSITTFRPRYTSNTSKKNKLFGYLEPQNHQIFFRSITRKNNTPSAKLPR